MVWQVSQEGHQAKITTSLGPDHFFLEGFTATEALSELFRITCDVLAEKPENLHASFGQSVSVTVEGPPLVGRAFHGVLAEAAMLDQVQGGCRFRLTLRPWLWMLSLGRNSRIFQHLSVRDIIDKVFKADGINPDHYDMSGLKARGVIVRDYCVQYEESDFAFVSRLMEDEGIYYFFRHTAGAHVMVLCDDKSAHKDFAGGDIAVRNETDGEFSTPHVSRLGSRERVNIASWLAHDQHPNKFGDLLMAKSDATFTSGVTPFVFHYPGGHAYLTDAADTDGKAYTDIRVAADAADAGLLTGEGDVFAIAVGDAIMIGGATKQKRMVCGATWRVSGQSPGAQQSSDETLALVEFESVNYNLGWRPTQRTPKPLSRGPQVATVVGKAGEVIDVDAMGRVLVQFPWDREGQSDEKSSCRIRVSQGWGDKDFGMMNIPRIGQEVIVDYLDGDMDRPIITGRVYNATKTVPHALPANKTVSTWKSKTVGKVGGSYDNAEKPPQSSDMGFNEIRYEDKENAEEIYVHAQRLFTAWYRLDETRTTGRSTTIRVGYDRTVNIMRNETKTVETGDETHTVSKGNLSTTVSKGDETRLVDTGKRTTTIEGKESLTVRTGDYATVVKTGNMSVEVDTGAHSTEVKLGNLDVKVDMGAVTIEAMQSITLKVGQSSVVIDQMGVTVKGMMISSEATIQSKTKGLLANFEADVLNTVKGAIVMIN